MSLDIAAVLREHQGVYTAVDPDEYQWCARCGGCEKALKGGYGKMPTPSEKWDLLAEHQAEKVMEHLRENGREEWGYGNTPEVVRPAATEESARARAEWNKCGVYRHILTDWEPQP